MRTYYVYIMANPSRTVPILGVTNDLARRVTEHRQHVVVGFTQKYNCIDLVYYEEAPDIFDAIGREKQLKRWRRSKKEALIMRMNPKYRDLSASSR